MNGGYLQYVVEVNRHTAQNVYSELGYRCVRAGRILFVLFYSSETENVEDCRHTHDIHLYYNMVSLAWKVTNSHTIHALFSSACSVSLSLALHSYSCCCCADAASVRIRIQHFTADLG